MKTKKVYKLKTSVKIFFVVMILLVGGIVFGVKKYQEYLYTKTNEYALKNLGYSEETTQLILDKLNEDEQKKVIDLGYNEFIPHFLTAKYFMFNNLY